MGFGGAHRGVRCQPRHLRARPGQKVGQGERNVSGRIEQGPRRSNSVDSAPYCASPGTAHRRHASGRSPGCSAPRLAHHWRLHRPKTPSMSASRMVRLRPCPATGCRVWAALPTSNTPSETVRGGEATQGPLAALTHRPDTTQCQPKALKLIDKSGIVELANNRQLGIDLWTRQRCSAARIGCRKAAAGPLMDRVP